jgi:hypothetical protein
VTSRSSATLYAYSSKKYDVNGKVHGFDDDYGDYENDDNNINE